VEQAVVERMEVAAQPMLVVRRANSLLVPVAAVVLVLGLATALAQRVRAAVPVSTLAVLLVQQPQRVEAKARPRFATITAMAVQAAVVVDQTVLRHPTLAPVVLEATMALAAAAVGQAGMIRATRALAATAHRV
jgi:hypothetical protein